MKTCCSAVLFFVVSAVCVFSSYPETIFAHSTETEDTVIIHIDEDGFEPNNITISPGTEVIFENEDEEDHWLATDDHPSHTRYDGTSLEEHCNSGVSSTFDSCSPISTGESWAFVFEKTGTFTYHDHLWPHLVGEITVEDENSANDENIFSRILDFFRQIFANIASFFITHDEDLALNSGNTEDEFYEELKTHYENAVRETDPREAIRALQEESSEDGQVSALCHDILHEIGHAAYKKYGSFKEAARFQSDFCNSGYTHGIFESYFESTDDPLSGLAEQCDEYASVSGRQFDLWQCHHGVGHGFMYLTGGDLDKSLTLCEEGLDRDGAESCQNGVFMEVFNREILAKENSYIEPDDPLLTCSTRDVAKGDCYLYIPTYLSQTRDMDFSDIFKECREAEFGYRSICIRGVGSEAMKRNMDDPDTVFDLCKQAGSFIDQGTCVRGMTSMHMNQTGSHSAGQELCEQAPQEFRGACNSVVRNKESFFK